MARLKEKYTAEVAPALMKQFGYKSVMQIPKIDKVVVNVGCGEAPRELQGAGERGERPEPDHRPEARDHPGPEVHRQLQAA